MLCWCMTSQLEGNQKKRCACVCADAVLLPQVTEAKCGRCCKNGRRSQKTKTKQKTASRRPAELLVATNANTQPSHVCFLCYVVLCCLEGLTQLVFLLKCTESLETGPQRAESNSQLSRVVRPASSSFKGKMKSRRGGVEIEEG